MNKKRNIFIKYLTPIFWLSLSALLSVVIIYRYFGLSLPELNEARGVLLFILVITFFSVIAFYYQSITKFKEWPGIGELLKQTGSLIVEFFVKIIPFFIFLYIYNSIHDITHLINALEFDSLLIKIDHFILFGHDIAILLEKVIAPWLTGLLSVSYSFFFIFYLINPIVYFLLKDKKIFDLVLTTVIITNFLGLVGYILVPCMGPILAQQDLFSKELIMPSGELYQESGDIAATYIYSRGSFHCFPSLHFGITFVWLYFAWKYLRKEKYLKYLYYLHIPVVFSLWLSIIYLRWHYIVDLVGGLLVALLGIWLAKKLIDWWYKRWSA